MRLSGALKLVVFVLFATGSAVLAADPPPIKVGEISSYSALPVGTRGYRQGWELARDEINKKGGVLGRSRKV